MFRYIFLALIVLSFDAYSSECLYEEKVLSYLSSERNQAIECFEVKQSDIEYLGAEIIEIKVSEVHNSICGGDPDTTPSAGIFKVNTKTCLISMMNFAEGEYQAIPSVKK